MNRESHIPASQPHHGDKTMVCACEDVTQSDIDAAIVDEILIPQIIAQNNLA